MSIDAVSINKIKSYLNKHALGDIYYSEFYEMLNGRKKYSDLSFLTYFVESINKVLDSNDKITNKMLLKYFECVFIFLSVCLDKELDIDISLIIKIKSFRDKVKDYNDYLTEDDYTDILGYLDKIEYLIKDKNIEESNNKYEDKISELESKVDKLNNLIKEKEKVISELKVKNNVLENDNSKYSDEVGKIREELKEKENSLYELDEIKKLLEESEKVLHSTTTELFNERDKNITLEEKVNDLNDRVSKQDIIIDGVNRENEISLRNEILDNYLLEILIKEELTFDKICKKVFNKFKEYSFDKNEIYLSLNRLGSKYSIRNYNNIIIPEVFSIYEPNVLSNNTLYLESNKDVMDIMLISDLHIKTIDKNIIKVMEEVYDYCSKHGIDKIINLGDFLDSNKNNMILDKTSFDNNLELLNKIIEKFPYDDNISHLILGGNHDRDNLIYGIDGLKYIADNRSDIVTLGYDNAIIEFISENEQNEFLGLHHKGLPVEVVGSYDLIEYPEKINSKLNKYYSSINREYKDSYIDIFGHAHRSRLDVISNYCIVPSLIKKVMFIIVGLGI